MESHQNLPDADRLSVVTAAILLAYALTPFVNLPGRSFGVQLPGFFFQISLNFTTIISFIVALLAAAGADWVIQGHPNVGSTVRLPHWLLPALTAWAIGLPLATLEVGLEWWAVFGLGGLLFVLVLVAEYIVVDPQDIRQAPASMGLIAVSFALYLVLAVSVKASELRLYSAMFVLVPTIFLVALRSMYLRLGGRWVAAWAIGIALVAGQAALVLHYLPVLPLRYGLLLIGLAYGLTSLATGIEDNRPPATIWIEPAIMLAILWGLAFLVRA